MVEGTQEILSEVIATTDNDVIIFSIIIAVILVIFLLPYITLKIKERKENKIIAIDAAQKREHELIQVIVNNTEKITTLINMVQVHVDKEEGQLCRVHTRLDELFSKLHKRDQDV